MTAEEIAKALTSGEAPLIIGAVLMLILWGIRNLGILRDMTSKQELIALGSAAASVVAAGLLTGAPWRQTLINGIVVLLVAMRWNSPPLPAKRGQLKAGKGGAGSLLLIAVLALSGCSQVLPAMVRIGNTSSLVSSYLGMIDDAAELWVQAHPEDLTGAQQLRGAMERTRRALVALERIGASVGAYEQGDVSAVRSELLAAYSALYHVAQELGIVPGGEPQLASYSARALAQPSQPVRQVEAITPDELSELLGGDP